MIYELFWKLRHAWWLFRGFCRRQSVSIQAWGRFWREYREYKRMSGLPARSLIRYLQPVLIDPRAITAVEPIYFHMNTWGFEKITQHKPRSHVDIGSAAIFVGMLSKVVDVTMVDIRPLSVSLDTLKFTQGSILELPYEDGSLSSVSSLCVLEHIGLGRYGDPLDPNGTELAIAELKRVLSPGGDLYIAVPTGTENITEYNAHRRFTDQYILEQFSPLELVESRYIVGPEIVEGLPSAGHSTGCYHFRRPA